MIISQDESRPRFKHDPRAIRTLYILDCCRQRRRLEMIEASAVGLRRAMEAHLAIATLGTRRNIPTTERCQIFNSCSLKSTTDWHDPWAEEWFAMLQMAATTTERTMRVSATKIVASQGCYGSQLISRNAFWMWASTLGSRRLMREKCLDRSMFCPIWSKVAPCAYSSST